MFDRSVLEYDDLDLENSEQCRDVLRALISVTEENMFTNNIFCKGEAVIKHVARNKITLFIRELVPILDSPISDLRANVILTLCSPSRLYLKEYKDKAFDMWLHDEDEHVRCMSLNAWIGYYEFTQDRDVIGYILEVFLNKESDSGLRSTCLFGLTRVSGNYFSFNKSGLPNKIDWVMDNESLNKCIIWSEIQEYIQTYVPEQLPKYQNLLQEYSAKYDAHAISLITLPSKSEFMERISLLLNEHEPEKDYAYDVLSKIEEALASIERHHLEELKELAIRYLSAKDNGIKAAAIHCVAVCFRDSVPNFKDKLLDWWFNHEYDLVKSYSLSSWFNYYAQKQDKSALNIAYSVALSEKCAVVHRYIGLSNLYLLTETPCQKHDFKGVNKLMSVLSHEQFNNSVDWDEFDAIVKKYNLNPGAVSH